MPKVLGIKLRTLSNGTIASSPTSVSLPDNAAFKSESASKSARQHDPTSALQRDNMSACWRDPRQRAKKTCQRDTTLAHQRDKHKSCQRNAWQHLSASEIHSISAT